MILSNLKNKVEQNPLKKTKRIPKSFMSRKILKNKVMSETKTANATDGKKAMYEYLQVRGTVINFTDQDMEITGSDLSWGKWINSPVNTGSMSMSTFGSQGRDSSPSGTTGWATWKIGDAVIRITFDTPLRGSNSQSISCSPEGAFKVTAQGTGGDINICTFRIQPAD